jgi:hypothetical protein
MDGTSIVARGGFGNVQMFARAESDFKNISQIRSPLFSALW